jgi:hypothetical protein
MDKNAPFPTDWNEWRAEWREWIGEQTAAGRLTRTSYRFPGRNFMADEILGTYGIPRGDGTGRNVELSEVLWTVGESVRYVGITYGEGGQRYTPSETGGNNLPATFAELETELYR